MSRVHFQLATHILCNPFYTLYATRPNKDRLSVLSVLQNTSDLYFRFGPETLALLTAKLALCWVHDGRHYERLSAVVPCHAAALESFRERYWAYDESLQDYRAGPSEKLASRLRSEFDELFSTRTGYDALDDRIAKTQAKRDELLTVLSEPAVPLHNNASELGARVSARRRDVSLHSRSVQGVRAMDIFTTLVQTSKKLGVSAYAYLRDRLRHDSHLPALAQSITQAAASV